MADDRRHDSPNKGTLHELPTDEEYEQYEAKCTLTDDNEESRTPNFMKSGSETGVSTRNFA